MSGPRHLVKAKRQLCSRPWSVPFFAPKSKSWGSFPPDSPTSFRAETSLGSPDTGINSSRDMAHIGTCLQEEDLPQSLVRALLHAGTRLPGSALNISCWLERPANLRIASSSRRCLLQPGQGFRSSIPPPASIIPQGRFLRTCSFAWVRGTNL